MFGNTVFFINFFAIGKPSERLQTVNNFVFSVYGPLDFQKFDSQVLRSVRVSDVYYIIILCQHTMFKIISLPILPLSSQAGTTKSKAPRT